MTSAAVLVCAYTLERWAVLLRAVTEAAAQLRAADTLTVVVDHNDGLLGVARASFEPLGVAVVSNTRRRGLSGARNTGITATTGDLVVFLDDDAVPDAGWLAHLVAPFSDASVGAVGGMAIPVWPIGHARPRFLPTDGHDAPGELDSVVGCSFRGQPTVRSVVRNPMGCTMAFRREVFDHVGGFREELGRIGTRPLGCEETELAIRMRRHDQGWAAVHEPSSVVRHHQAPARLTWRYFWARCYAEGVSKAVVVSLQSGTQDALSTEAAYVSRVLPRAVARELTSTTSGVRQGLAGAAAVVSGLGATTAGYVRGRCSARAIRLPAANGVTS